jgi:methionyl-tRNA formyltransferase
MRIVFFGTPAFAVPSLEALLDEGEQVVAVVTQPDRARGRSRSTLDPSPIKVRAVAGGIPVLQPERPIGDAFVSALRDTHPDLGVVVAYGHILKPEVLSIPRLEMINVHASLLPSWRGAAPIQWSILAGDAVTGVTIMRMEAGLDSGPVLHRLETPIGPDETGGELTARLAGRGAAARRRALVRLRDGSAAAEPQDHARATFAPKIDHDLARIRWDESAERVARRIRAFEPAPGAWSKDGGVQVLDFRPAIRRFSGPPGSVLVSGSEVVIAAGERSVAVAEVKPAGKTRMATPAWLRGHPLPIGTRFE